MTYFYENGLKNDIFLAKLKQKMQNMLYNMFFLVKICNKKLSLRR